MQYGIWVGVALQLALYLLFGLKATLIVNAATLALTCGWCLWASRAAMPESDSAKPAGGCEPGADSYSGGDEPAAMARFSYAPALSLLTQSPKG